MGKKLILIILIAAIFFLLNSITIFAFQNKTYTIPNDVSLLNIIVNKEDKFTIEINGAGWYVNRYTKDKISILLRVVDDNKTKFDIKANEQGEAYIFFSLIGQDKYLHILIKKGSAKSISSIVEKAKIVRVNTNNKIKVKSQEEKNLMVDTNETLSKKIEPSRVVSNEDNVKAERANKTEVDEENPKKNSVEIANEEVKVSSKNNKIKNEPLSEKKIISTPTEVKPQDNKLITKKKKESEIYFIDKKSKKKISVPFEDENKSYFEAIDQLKNNNDLKAVDLFNSYLNKCKDCTYREDAIFNIAKAYVDYGKDKKAFEYYQKIISVGIGKHYNESLKWIGDYYYNKRDLKKAIVIYQKLYGETKKTDIMRKIADIAYALGDIEKSLKGYNYCVQNGLIEDKVLFMLASIYDKPGKFRDVEKAYNFYHKIVESYPKSKYFDFSKKRVSFFEKNFINIE